MFWIQDPQDTQENDITGCTGSRSSHLGNKDLAQSVGLKKILLSYLAAQTLVTNGHDEPWGINQRISTSLSEDSLTKKTKQDWTCHGNSDPPTAFRTLLVSKLWWSPAAWVGTRSLSAWRMSWRHVQRKQSNSQRNRLMEPLKKAS